MTDIKPRFFDTPLKLLAHLEWEAIQAICFNGSRMDMGDAFPKFEQRRFYWIDPFNDRRLMNITLSKARYSGRNTKLLMIFMQP